MDLFHEMFSYSPIYTVQQIHYSVSLTLMDFFPIKHFDTKQNTMCNRDLVFILLIIIGKMKRFNTLLYAQCNRDLAYSGYFPYNISDTT